MDIGRKDVIWNLLATSMRIASGLIVLPLALRLLPSQEIGIWNLFVTIGSLAVLLDFGFSNSFTRSVTYVFSGVKELKTEGFISVNQQDKSVNYGLLYSVINAMKRYYGILSGIFFISFMALSPFYLTSVLRDYTGNSKEIWISWFIFGILVSYQLYTYYYSSLLTGRGLVRKNLQIIVLGQSIRILTTVIGLSAGWGIISMIIGLFLSEVFNRTLCYFAFYDKQIKNQFKNCQSTSVRETMKMMTPNAVKIGVTTLGSFLINKISLIIAPIFISLSELGSYGTTKQVIDLIITIGALWFNTYYPKITLNRVNNNLGNFNRMYIKSKILLISITFSGCLGLIVFGPFLLKLIHSQTQLLPLNLIICLSTVSFLESNHSMAAMLLLTENKVPFAKASIISGLATLIMLIFFFKYTHIGIWGMILAPGIAQGLYQNWKWPLQVRKEYKIYFSDFLKTFRLIVKK